MVNLPSCPLAIWLFNVEQTFLSACLWGWFKKLYEDKAYFHKEQARLPFEAKIKILVKLQEIASRIKGSDKIIWK